MSAGTPAAARLRTVQEGPVRRLVLARPEVRNAFDDQLIAELTEAVGRLAGGIVARRRLTRLSLRGSVEEEELGLGRRNHGSKADGCQDRGQGARNVQHFD